MSSPTRRAGRAGGTRQRLLEAARRLIQQQGADRVRLEDIARAAGISRRALYLHFPSRTAFFVALLAWIDESQELPALIERIWAADSGVAALDRVVELQAAYNPQIHQIAQAIDAARRRDPATAAAWEDRMAGRRRGCRRVAQWLDDEHTLADGWSVEGAADLLWTLTSLRVWHDLVIERGWSPDDYVRHLERLLRATLVRP